MGVPKMDKWFMIEPIGAGVFGVPVGIAVIVIVSLLTKAPDQDTQELVEHVRYPQIKGDTLNTAGAE
jgi:cation/acetate symporter